VGVGGGGLRQRVPTAPRLFGTVDAYGGAAVLKAIVKIHRPIIAFDLNSWY